MNRAIAMATAIALLLLATTLSGCTQERYPQLPDAQRHQRYENLSNHEITFNEKSSFDKPTGDGYTQTIGPTGSGRAWESISGTCDPKVGNDPDLFWIRVLVARPSDEPYYDPTPDEPGLLFKGNWTGAKCGALYWMVYRGPGDASMYETYNMGGKFRESVIIRELERVPF